VKAGFALVAITLVALFIAALPALAALQGIRDGSPDAAVADRAGLDTVEPAPLLKAAGINNPAAWAAAPSAPTATFTPKTSQCSDGQEPNDGFGQAYLISAGVQYSGCIPTPGDLDYFRFAVALNTRIRVELFDLPQNYDLYLYSPAGSLLIGSANARPAPANSMPWCAALGPLMRTSPTI
jgi:hypothetical protein